MTLHNVTILIKSVFSKDQNHYYYIIFLEKCWYHLAKKNDKFFFDSIIILRFGDTKVGKENLYGVKKAIKILNVNVNNVVISKLVETKESSKYLIG